MFSIRLLGYDRTEVEQQIANLQAKLDELTTAYEDSKQQVGQLQAYIEDYEIRLASARRDRAQALSQSGFKPSNIIVLIGPVSTFSSIAPLADTLDKLPDLSIQFRVFRDGFYRIDAWIENVDSLTKWLQSQTGVRAVHCEQDTLHVTIKDI